MTTPTARRGKTVLSSGDQCPRGCRTGSKGAVHLMSDHTVEATSQCSKCACVVQDVHDIKPGS